MTRWDEVALGDVATLDTRRHDGSDKPFVGLEHIEPGTGRLLRDVGQSEAESGTFEFDPRHVLFGRLRPYLNKAHLPTFRGRCSTEIFPIRPHAALDRRYLFHWITKQTTIDAIMATCTGARMPRANMREVLNLRLPLPPLAEQQRIVVKLDDMLAGIAGATENAARSLASAIELFSTFRDSVLQGDAAWPKQPLGSVLKVKHGFAFESRYFTQSGDQVLLTPGNFYEHGGFRDRGMDQKRYLGPTPPDFVLPSGALLVAMTEQAAGLLGSSLIVPEGETYLHNQRLGLVLPLEESSWDSRFFYHLFNTTALRRYLHDGATGTKVRHTSPGRIEAFESRIPPTREEKAGAARRIDAIAKETDTLISLQQRRLAALVELKQSLLASAFAGDLTREPLAA